MPVSDEEPVLGRRIVVYGNTGSGKSTLARDLAASLGLSVIELDAISWQPDWQQLSREELTNRALAAIERTPDGWVLEGSYSATRPYILPLADTVIWLNLPWRVSFWRMLLRSARRLRSGEVLWNTNRESLRSLLASRDSLIWFAIHHHRAGKRSIRKALSEIPHVARVYELQSTREVQALLNQARRQQAAG